MPTRLGPPVIPVDNPSVMVPSESMRVNWRFRDWWADIPHVRRMRLAMLMTRGVLGGTLLLKGIARWQDPHGVTWLTTTLQTWATGAPVFWIEDLLRGVLIPHAGLLCPTLAIWEAALGVVFLVGAWTRQAAVVLLVLVGFQALATAHLGESYALSAVGWAGLAGVAALGQAGRCWGVEGIGDSPDE